MPIRIAKIQLIAESLEEVTLDKKGCEVVKGKWYDSYTNKYFTNPSDYIKTWQKIKKQWKLIMDDKEKVFIQTKNKECKIK
jgi:hypothetical protein